VKRVLLAGAWLIACPSSVLAQYVLGYEFLVNTSTTGAQARPDVASDAHGNFVVAWHAPDGILARRFSADGVPLGGEFLVAPATAGYPRSPRVASSAVGDFVVVWQSDGPDGGQRGVFGRRFEAAGAALGGAFQVNTYTTGNQYAADVAADPSGNFVVVWQSEDQDSAAFDVFAQRFDAAGGRLGGEFRVHSAAMGHFGDQTAAAVDMDPTGAFVVAWQHRPTFGPGRPDVFAQRFDAAGTPQGSEFQVSVDTMLAPAGPSVAMADDGGFMIVWTRLGAGFPIPSSTVLGRSFDALGAPRTGEFGTPGFMRKSGASVDVDRNGRFVVVWEDGDLFESDVVGVFVDALGTPLSDAFRVNTYTTRRQTVPVVASSADENFVVIWESDYQDGADLGVFGQLYGDLVFRDGYESGDLARWDFAQTGGGDLSVTGAAALAGTTAGMQAVVDGTNPLFVQDDTPDGENRYRARFYFDPNGFDPGEAGGRRRVRLFIAFDGQSRRVVTIVLRRLNGEYSLMGRVRLSDGTRASTPFFPITDAPHFVELFWTREDGPTVVEGLFRLFVDGSVVSNLAPLDNDLGTVDFVRLGALTIKPGASGTIFFDQFESRRVQFIGPEE
jgi:hypothetical protein